MSYEDTYNTLKYADRAKSIKSKLVRNVLNVDFHVSRYAKIVEDLRTEVCGKHQPEQACFMPLSRVLSSLVRAHFPKSGAGYDAYKQNRVVFLLWNLHWCTVHFFHGHGTFTFSRFSWLTADSTSSSQTHLVSTNWAFAPINNPSWIIMRNSLLKIRR